MRDYYVTTVCPFCGKIADVAVNFVDYVAWQNGELAQRAFPYLSADEREMLITGICPHCWNSMFGGEEDEEEDEGETLDEALHQFGIDALATIFGGEEPPEEEGIEIYEGSAEDIFHILFGGEM